MTELIKQWIADQNHDWGEIGERPKWFSDSDLFRSGLTKGIEIAEGFAEWAEDYVYFKKHNRWVWGNHINDIEFVTETNSFTTSQLFEQYLKTLEP